MGQEYDRYAKQLWVKVYQDARSQKESRIIAKDIADLAMADYMSSIHGVTSVVKENFTTEKDYEDGWNEWNDCKAKYTSTKNIIEERDNYYNELQKLRQENADLEAENKRIRIKLSDTLYDLVETKAENKRLKEQNENLDVAYMAGVTDGKRDQSVDTTNMIAVPFKLDWADGVLFINPNDTSSYSLYNYCRLKDIDQTKIKRILLEMKSEDE